MLGMKEKTYDMELEAAKRMDGSIDTTKLIELYMNKLGRIKDNISSYAKDDSRWLSIAKYVKNRNNPDVIFVAQDMISLLLDNEDDKCLHGRAYEILGDLSKCKDIVMYTQSNSTSNGKRNFHFGNGTIDV